jgi:hypothetical protein
VWVVSSVGREADVSVEGTDDAVAAFERSSIGL